MLSKGSRSSSRSLMAGPSRVTTYVFALTGAALALVVVLFVIAGVPTFREWPVIALFAVLGLIAHLQAYDRGGRMLGSVAFLPFLAAGGMVPNMGTVGAYALVIGIGELVSKRDSIKRLFNFSQQLGGFALGVECYLLAGGTGSLVVRPAIEPFVVLYVTTKMANLLAFSGVMKFAAGRSFRRELVTQMARSLAQDAIAIPLAFLFAIAVLRFGVVWSALLLIPLLAVRQMFRQSNEAVRAHEETLELMVAAIEARDPYTSGHSVRAARYSFLIASLAGRREREIKSIQKAALLHDIGKIHVQFASLLGLERRLTPEETLVMQSHTEKGAELVARVSTFKDLVPYVRSHHERWDGTGYPHQLTGAAIPYGARVLAIADTIDAMTTDRPYRLALSTADVAAEIARLAGQQFDPTLSALVLIPANWRRIEQAIAEEHGVDASSFSMAATAEYPPLSFVA